MEINKGALKLEQEAAAEATAAVKALEGILHGKLETSHNSILASKELHDVLDQTRNIAATKSIDEAIKALRGMEKKMEEIIVRAGFDAKELGVKSNTDLARLYLQMLEREEVWKYSNKELTEKASGLRGRLAGELFQLLVENHKDLTPWLEYEANLVLRDAHSLIISSDANKLECLVDSAGKPVNMDVIQTIRNLEKNEASKLKIVRATDIWTYASDGRKQFTDFAYVAVFEHAGKQHAVFLVGVEVKMPAAARSFPKQIASFPNRHESTEGVLMKLDGKEVSFDKSQMIFVRSRGANMIAVRPKLDSHDISYFAPVKSEFGTSKLKNPGGKNQDKIPAVYDLYTIKMDANKIRKMVNLVFVLLK